ncbi:Lipase 1 [Actinomadura rubteroloni]|uniref:Poly(ethylene terephthalate) hydrolase n=1 Tax=Actinomadura rubteroloni TaxID=1926885 RepID=A0A2P4UDP6_9ACTN|nr:dienelactone hydrolase family protein [Actinomadura rubteroloni]POM23177.1 Lipase 1 [Actinomadura rubteroloni]
MKSKQVIAALGLAAAVIAAPAQALAAPNAAIAAAPRVAPAANPYERGPAPTEESVKAEKGPFDIAQMPVPGGAGVFGGGTIWYPKDEAGPFGAVVVSPGFMTLEPLIQWYGRTLASHGFVVMTMATITPIDPPFSRGDELRSALDYLVTKSTVKDKIDPTRTALMGHSMGGGGTLDAASKLPDLKAAIPLAPWNLDYAPPAKIKAPTLIIGADNDPIAPTAAFADPFYAALTTQNRAYLKLKNAGHTFSFLGYNPTITKYTVSWLKRFVDNDTRYDQFLCPIPAASDTVAAYQGTCPLT